jgi:hypothetical protein
MPLDPRIVHRSIPLAARATLSIGGSYEIAKQRSRMEQILAAWKLLHPQGDAPPPPAPEEPPHLSNSGHSIGIRLFLAAAFLSADGRS